MSVFDINFDNNFPQWVDSKMLCQFMEIYHKDKLKAS